MEGVAQEGLSSRRSVIAVRPDDIVVDASANNVMDAATRNVILGQAEIVEDGGRDFLGDAFTESGLLFHARTPRRSSTRGPLRLTSPNLIGRLVYPYRC